MWLLTTGIGFFFLNSGLYSSFLFFRHSVEVNQLHVSIFFWKDSQTNHVHFLIYLLLTYFSGFLQFRLHNLLVAKIALLQRNKTLTKTEMNKIGVQLGETLKESARILYQDHGCPKELIEIITNISQINSETIKPA